MRRNIPFEFIKGGLFVGAEAPLGIVPGEVEEGRTCSEKSLMNRR